MADPDPERVESRAEALAEEEADLDVDDHRRQAEAMLADSDEREIERGALGNEAGDEHRTSEETVEPAG